MRVVNEYRGEVGNVLLLVEGVNFMLYWKPGSRLSKKWPHSVLDIISCTSDIWFYDWFDINVKTYFVILHSSRFIVVYNIIGII